MLFGAPEKVRFIFRKRNKTNKVIGKWTRMPFERIREKLDNFKAQPKINLRHKIALI